MPSHQLASSIVTWKITNFSLLSQMKKSMTSPCFFLNGPSESCFMWTLFLQPNTATGNYGIYLGRKTKDGVFDSVTVPLKYVLSIWNDNKCIRTSSIIYTFASDTSFGFPDFVNIQNIDKIINNATEEDNLTIKCTIWTNVDTVTTGVQLTKLTSIIPISEESQFEWEIRCSDPNIINNSKTFNIKSHLGNSLSVAFLYITQDNEKVIQVEISGNVKKESAWICCFTLAKTGDIFLLEFDALKEDSLPYKKILKPLITSQNILENPDTYLTGGSLVLNCKLTIVKKGIVHISANSTISNLKMIQDLLIVPDFKEDTLLFSTIDEYCLDRQLADAYFSEKFSDFTIQVKSKSFPVHRFFLSARSTVFSSMLTTDMEEKNKGTLTIEDLDEDTVRDMLYYVYGDEFSPEDVESALKLYSAADKYALNGLVRKCQEFLVKHLSTSNVFEVLELAERYDDPWLQECINSFFLLYEKEISLCDEFRAFSDRNPSLAARTWVNVMKLKYG